MHIGGQIFMWRPPYIFCGYASIGILNFLSVLPSNFRSLLPNLGFIAQSQRDSGTVLYLTLAGTVPLSHVAAGQSAGVNFCPGSD